MQDPYMHSTTKNPQTDIMTSQDSCAPAFWRVFASLTLIRVAEMCFSVRHTMLSVPPRSTGKSNLYHVFTADANDSMLTMFGCMCLEQSAKS